MASHNGKLLIVENLKKYYPITKGLRARHVGDVKAVDGVSLHIDEKETLGLVGESGCGKSTLGRTVLRLEEPTAGRVLYKGADITRLDSRGLKQLRSQIQIIFQDPQSSLDPRMTIGDSIAEALLVHGVKDDAERLDRVARLLELVGLEADFAGRYPHEFSGGQKQRIGIARAIAVNPRLIVADEPVSALDVSIQAQILNLMMDLQDEFQMAYLFIAHDLCVIRHISNRIAVMYLGKIVELASKEEMFLHPCHPYTQALLSAVSVPNPHIKKQRILLPGDVPSPINPPPGCHFHTRCFRVMDVCSRVEPQLKEVSAGHLVSCHLYTGGDRA